MAHRHSKLPLFTIVAGNAAVFLALKAAEPGFPYPPATRALAAALGCRPRAARRALERRLLLSPAAFAERPSVLLASSFAHFSPLHLLGNMVGLWSFGGLVSARLGWRPCVALHLGGALAGGAAHLAHARALRRDVPALGASAGVLSLAAFVWACNPSGTSLVVVFPVRNWALLALAGGGSAWGVGQGLGGGGGWRGAGDDGAVTIVGHAAHLGGLAFGALAAAVFLARRRRLG
jgi:membrane associated rhomboid family serine protease